MSTFLEAINFVLAQSGATATTSESDTLPAVTDAKLRLAEADLWLQKKGWWFNTDFNVELSPVDPGVNDKIAIPAGTIKVLTQTSGFLLIRDDGFFYNPYTQSNEFATTDHFHLDLVKLVPWVDLPQSAQDAIKFSAARMMVLIDLEDNRKAESLKDDFTDAFVDVKKEDLEVKKRNIRFNPTHIAVTGRVRPYRRGFMNRTLPGGGR